MSANAVKLMGLHISSTHLHRQFKTRSYGVAHRIDTMVFPSVALMIGYQRLFYHSLGWERCLENYPKYTYM